MAIVPPNSRIEKPELFLPGHKPTSEVRIDWTHPLASELKVLYLFQNGIGYEYVSGIVSPIVGTASQITRHQDYVDFTGDQRVGYSFGPISFTSTDPWTCTFETDYDGDLQEGLITGEYSNTLYYIWLREGNYLRVVTSSGQNHQTTLLTSFTTRAFYSITTSPPGGSGFMSFYKDGLFIDNDTSGGSTAMTFDALGSAYPNDNNAYDGRVYFYALHGRRLSDGEIHSLHNDPYQLLIPA